jgi:2,3-dihydroxybenzoate decarboxylase
MSFSRRAVIQTLLASGAILRSAASRAQPNTILPADATIAPNRNYRRIATEEAWITREIADELMRYIASGPHDPGFIALGGRYYARGASSPLLADMIDVGAGRIAAMDRLGIDKQLLLLTAPGVQVFTADTATALAADSNDQLAAAIAAHPDRFAGLAAVAPQNPARAAKEIERAMTVLGLNGVVINSHTHGEFLDDEKFWEILEAAEAFDAPIYIHPRDLAPAMLQPYLERTLEAGILGFAADVALHTVALIVAGAFDRFPNLKLAIGHAGEGLPYMLYRIDYMQRAVREGRGQKQLAMRPSDYFKRNIYITTSGMAWEPAIKFAQATLGVDRVLYAMDYPYQADANEVVAMDKLDISDADKKMFFQTNAEKLFALRD